MKQRKKKEAIKKKHSPGFSFYSSETGFLALLLFCVFFSYLSCFQNGFVNWDDEGYITGNPLWKTLNLKGIFFSFQMGNYHPVTMLVYAIAYRFFGDGPAGYHFLSLLIHIINTFLVYRFVRLLSEKKEVAFIAALLFGIHPMHVESVAWASELKDLLYTCFFLCAATSYLQFLSVGKRKLYIYTLFFFFLALLSKAMAVSLPAVLILIDFYRHRRFGIKELTNKIPFFLLAVIFGVVAIFAQHSSEAFSDISLFSFPQRCVFACYGAVMYAAKLMVPIHLSAFYPYPVGATGIFIHYFIYPLICIAGFLLVLYSLKYSAKLFFGTSFFICTIFLVLQLLPVGRAIMADRYVYLPSVGFFYLVGEAVNYAWRKNFNSYARLAIVAAGTAIIFCFCVTTYERCAVWQNGMSLWTDVIKKEPGAATAYNNRAYLFMKEDRKDEALQDYNKAIELRKDYVAAYNSRGFLYYSINEPDKALDDYREALRLDAHYADTYYNRALLWSGKKRDSIALNDYNNAIRYKPAFANAYMNRGGIYFNNKDFTRAIADYTVVINLADNSLAYYDRGLAEYNSGNKENACTDLHKAEDMGLQVATAAVKELCR